MESNGRGVTRDGRRVAYGTGAGVKGEPGTAIPSTLFQLLHQGMPVALDLLAPVNASSRFQQQQVSRLRTLLAQARRCVRAADRVRAQLAPRECASRSCRGSRHTRRAAGDRAVSLLFPRLTPRTLGRLIATQGLRAERHLGPNPFDQWGVELGKLAGSVIPAVVAGTA
jgi:glucose-6-phosphate isomerase